MTLAARCRNTTVTACFFGSGCLALIYEICWVREASLAFGSATLALSTVLAVFFGGLALGSYLMSALVRRVQRPLIWYAGIEIAVGLCALFSPWGFAAADRLFESIYPWAEGSFLGLTLIRFGLLAAILLLPATLMGGTLPLLCRFFVHSDRSMTRSIGSLYALNTLGAAAGCAAAGFWLIPHFGVQWTLQSAAVVNLLLGALVACLRCGAGSRETGRDAATARIGSPRSVIGIASMFFLTGFLALGNEVLWARFLSLLMHDTVYTYTLTLTTVLVGMVVGSLLSAGLFDRGLNRPIWLGGIQMAGGVAVLGLLLAPVDLWMRLAAANGFASQVAVSALVLAVPAVLSGMSYPLFVRLACDGPAEVAVRIGQLTACNTLGGIAGSLSFGFVAIPLFGLQQTLLLATGCSCAAGIAIWFLFDHQVRRSTKVVASVACAALWIGLPAWSGTSLPADYLGRSSELVEIREGLNGHLAVVRHGEFLRLEVDRLWQGENRKTHQIMAAHVPMLFHPRPKRVAVVGIGPGQTASRFLMHPIERLDCVDIEAELVPLIRRYFDGAWLDDPRVKIIVDDGRNFITHTDRKYDLISIEVGQTFRPCVSGFYAIDFYERARLRLADEGILVQFASLEFLGPDDLKTVIRSFVEVFPQSVLWYNRAELLLIGSTAKQISLCQDQLARLLSDPRIHDDLDFGYWGGHACRLNRQETLLAGFLAGPCELARLAESGRPYYSDRPFLEYATSAPDPGAQRQAVELLNGHRGDIRQLTDDLQPAAVAEIHQLQVQNLRDLLATELNYRALATITRRDLEATIAWARQARQFNPQNFWSNLLLADALAANGQPREAVEHYETAIALRPDDAGVRARLSLAKQNSE